MKTINQTFKDCGRKSGSMLIILKKDEIDMGDRDVESDEDDDNDEDCLIKDSKRIIIKKAIKEYKNVESIILSIVTTRRLKLYVDGVTDLYIMKLR